jgi:hypothetical protein
MTVLMLLPYFKPSELVKFFRLNKECNLLMSKHLKFPVLFEAWDIQLTPAQLEETKISTSRALQVSSK